MPQVTAACGAVRGVTQNSVVLAPPPQYDSRESSLQPDDGRVPPCHWSCHTRTHPPARQRHRHAHRRTWSAAAMTTRDVHVAHHTCPVPSHGAVLYQGRWFPHVCCAACCQRAGSPRRSRPLPRRAHAVPGEHERCASVAAPCLRGATDSGGGRPTIMSTGGV